MQHITRLLACFREAELPLRPLLYAAGAAVTAAGVYYYFTEDKCDDDEEEEEEEERQADQEHTPLSQALQTVGTAGSSGVMGELTVPQTDSSSVPAEDSLKDPEEKNQAGEVLGALMDSEVACPEERVRELEKQLCEERRMSALKTKNLEVSLAKAEEKRELATESCNQLEMKRSSLLSELIALKKSYSKTERMLGESCKRCSNLTMKYEEVQEAHAIMKMECDKLQQCVKKWCEVIEDSQAAQTEAELTCRQVQMTNAELEKENHCLRGDSEVLQDCVHELEKKLSKLKRKYDKLIENFELQCKDHIELHSKYEEMTEMLNHSEMMLKDCQASLATSEEKNEMLTRTFTMELSDMEIMVNDLKGTILQLEVELREAHVKQDEATANEEQSGDSQRSENDLEEDDENLENEK